MEGAKRDQQSLVPGSMWSEMRMAKAAEKKALASQLARAEDSSKQQ
jgi:hypothetical protein